MADDHRRRPVHKSSRDEFEEERHYSRDRSHSERSYSRSKDESRERYREYDDHLHRKSHARRPHDSWEDDQTYSASADYAKEKEYKKPRDGSNRSETGKRRDHDTEYDSTVAHRGRLDKRKESNHGFGRHYGRIEKSDESYLECEHDDKLEQDVQQLRNKKRHRSVSTSSSDSGSSSGSEHRSRSKKRRRRSRSRSRDRSSRDNDKKRDKKKHKKDKEERRSALTGKKIKLKVKKDRGDHERDANRKDLLQFLNASYD